MSSKDAVGLESRTGRQMGSAINLSSSWRCPLELRRKSLFPLNIERSTADGLIRTGRDHADTTRAEGSATDWARHWLHSHHRCITSVREGGVHWGPKKVRLIYPEHLSLSGPKLTVIVHRRMAQPELALPILRMYRTIHCYVNKSRLFPIQTATPSFSGRMVVAGGALCRCELDHRYVLGDMRIL